MSGNTSDNNSSSGDRRRQQARFATTSWTVVLQAAETGSGNHDALATLCEAYWYPLYSFVRRLGNTPSDAEDLTQSFFIELLEKSRLTKSDPERGRFRTFLLTSLQNFLKNEHRKASTIKRGGQQQVLSLDFSIAESRYQLEPTHEQTAQKNFDRNWAFALLDQVLKSLQQQYLDSGKSELFDALKGQLIGHESAPYSTIGEQLGMKEGAVKVAMHRLRERYGQMLRLQIAKTIEDPTDVDQEMRYLFDVLSDA